MIDQIDMNQTSRRTSFFPQTHRRSEQGDDREGELEHRIYRLGDRDAQMTHRHFPITASTAGASFVAAAAATSLM